jgi:hypothetical protein
MRNSYVVKNHGQSHSPLWTEPKIGPIDLRIEKVWCSIHLSGTKESKETPPSKRLRGFSFSALQTQLPPVHRGDGQKKTPAIDGRGWVPPAPPNG